MFIAKTDELETPKPSKNILLRSLIAALIGGVLTFIFFTGSLEKALNLGSQSTNSAGAGLGIIAFIGTFIWNIFICTLGALFSGFCTAITLWIYYFISNKKILEPNRNKSQSRL